MANYFTNFSFIVTLADTAQRDYALHLFLQMSAIQQGEDIPPDFPASLMSVTEDCTFELDPGNEPHELWFHSDSGGVDAVGAFVQHLLRQFDPQGVVSFEWSHDCSKPRTDAYGGGAAHITAREIKTLSTAEWLREQTQSHPPLTHTPTELPNPQYRTPLPNPLMHDLYQTVLNELKLHGLWRPCYQRVRFKSPLITPAYGYWWAGRDVIRVGRLSLLGLWNHWARGETRPSHKDVIRHELGHVVLDKNLPLARQLGYGRLFGTPASYHPKSHVSEYAASNADEDFAETVMFYLKHKGRLPRRFSGSRLRRKWNFVRRLGRHLSRKS